MIFIRTTFVLFTIYNTFGYKSNNNILKTFFIIIIYETNIIIQFIFILQIWSAGQSMGLIQSVPSTADLMAQFMGEAEDILRNRLQNILISKM